MTMKNGGSNLVCFEGLLDVNSLLTNDNGFSGAIVDSIWHKVLVFGTEHCICRLCQ